MVANQDGSGDEHSKKDYLSSESKKRAINIPTTPQIPVAPNNTGYSSAPVDTSDEKQRVIIPVPSYSYDNTNNYNSQQHGQEGSNEYHFHSADVKAMFESDKRNRETLLFPEKSKGKVIMPVPSNELEGKKAGDWDESIIVPTSARGSENTDSHLWAQHREVKQGTQKLIMPVHYSRVKEEVADQLEHEHEKPVTELIKDIETTVLTSSEIEELTEISSETITLKSETDTKKQPLGLKSLKEEPSNLKGNVQKTSVTQFLYNKEYKSDEKPTYYEIKDLDAYIEDFADDSSLIYSKQPQNISAIDKSHIKKEKVKPLDSSDKKEKEKAFSDKTAEKPAKSKVSDLETYIKDFTDEASLDVDEASLIYPKQPQKISAVDKSHVKTEKVKPLESWEKEKGKSIGEISKKQSESFDKPAKSETKDLDFSIKDFADEASLIHSKQPQKISTVEKSTVKTEKVKPLEFLEKKEKGKAIGEITKSAEKILKSETQDLDPSIKDISDEASLIHSKQPQKISAVDKSHVKTEKVKPPESWEKKEKGKGISEILNKPYKSTEKPEKGEIPDLETYIKDFTDEASLVHSKQSHKTSAVDKSQVKTEKLKPSESLEKKEKGKVIGEITDKLYKSAEKPAKSGTQDLDSSIKDIADEASVIHSKQPPKISAVDKSHIKTEKLKPLEPWEEKEKGKAIGGISKSSEKASKSETQDLDPSVKDITDEASLLKQSKQPLKISAADKRHVVKIVKPPESWEDKEKGKATGEITDKQYKSFEKDAKSEPQDLDPSMKDIADEASLIHTKQPAKVSAVDKSQLKTEKEKPLQSLEKKEKGKAYAEADNLTEYAKEEKASLARKSTQKDTSVKYEVSEGKRDSGIQRKVLTNNIKIKENDQDESKGKISDIKRIYRDEPPFEKEKQGRMTDDKVSAIEKYLQQEISKVSPEKVRRDMTGPMKGVEPDTGENAKTDANTEADLKTTPSKPSTEQKVYKWKKLHQNEDDNMLSYTKPDTTDMTTKCEEIKKTKDALKPIKDHPVREQQKIPYQEGSPPQETQASPPKETKVSALKETKESALKETKEYLPKETKESLPKETKDSLPKETKESLPKETKESLAKETKEVLPKETKEFLPKETKESLPKETKESFPKETKESLLKETKASLPKETKESLPKESKESIPKEIKETPSKEIKASPSKETKASPPKDTMESPIKDTKGSPSKETKGSPSRDTKESPSKDTKGSPFKDTKGSPSKETKESPPKETKGSPPKDTKGSPPKDPKGSPPKDPKGSPPKDTKGSPPKNTKGSPPKNTKGFPPKSTKGSPPKHTKGSPPKETKGSSPKETSSSEAAKPDMHTSFDKYSSGKNGPNMHSSFDKYSTEKNDQDIDSSFDKYSTKKSDPHIESSFDKYYTRQNEPNVNSQSQKYSTAEIERTEEILYDKQNTHFKAENTKLAHPLKPDHTNLTVPVSHYIVSDTNDTKLEGHKSQNINQQNEISSKSTTQSQATNLSTESTTRQGVTSQSITLLDSPPRYMVKDIKESEVTKPSGNELQPGIAQNTAWSAHKLSSVNEKYLGKPGHPSSWGDAGTFLPWVTYAAQKKNNQNNLVPDQSGSNSHHVNAYGYGSGSPLRQFLGRQYDVFKDNFNNHTVRGRANVAKATLLAVGLFTVWQMLKPKKCELTFQRCSECGSVTPMEKRH